MDAEAEHCEFNLDHEDLADRLKAVKRIAAGNDVLATGALLRASDRGAVTLTVRTWTATVVTGVAGTGTAGASLTLEREVLGGLIDALPKPKKPRSRTATPVERQRITVAEPRPGSPVLISGERRMPLRRHELPVTGAEPLRTAPVLDVDGERFRWLTRKALVARGKDDRRLACIALYLTVRSDGITLATTDRYRVAEGHLDATTTFDAAFEERLVLIDAATILNALPTLSGPKVSIGLADASVSFTAAGTMLTMTPLDVTAINYRQAAFEWAPAATIITNRARLIDECTVAGKLSKAVGDVQHTRLTFRRTDTGGSVQATPACSQHEEDVDAPAVEAEITAPTDECSAVFNSAWLLEALDSATTTRIAIELKSVGRAPTPVRFTAVPETDDDRARRGSPRLEHALISVKQPDDEGAQVQGGT